MSIFSKVKIGQSASNYSKFDLSHDHLTTLDFSQLCAPFMLECNIGDKISVDLNTFSRVAPMVFPTYGDVGLRSLFAFVPYYTLAEDADSYLSGLKMYQGNPSTGRFIYAYNLVHMYLGNSAQYHSNGFASIVDPQNGWVRAVTRQEYDSLLQQDFSKYDLPRDTFMIRSYEGSKASPGSELEPVFYKMTAKGKYFYKILKQLGYDIPQIYVFYKDSPTNIAGSFTWGLYPLNMYPLLAYLKVYTDLLMPNSYYQTSKLVKFLYEVRMKSYHTNMPSIVSSSGYIDEQSLSEAIENFTKVFYDTDYFTSAWQYPNQAIDSANVSQVPREVNRYLGSNTRGQEATKFGNELLLNNTDASLSQTQLKFLRAFDTFVRKNNLVGYRDYNAIYARYGLKTAEMRSHYAQLIDIRNINLNVGDVTATAQSADTLLGSYAGKGFINGNNSINFEAKDFGILIQVCYLYVKPMYFQGLRSSALRNDFTEFYQPEFDGVGSTPISQLELNVNCEDKVFGFTERYNDYRFKLSNITGDFAIDEDMHPWHVGRFIDYRTPPTSQTNNFLTYGVDKFGNCEYDRVFSTQNVGTAYDHFYMVFNYKVNALRKMKSISMAQDLGQGDIVLDRNGSV